ncbi:hypothetical protein PIB30_068758 [Stylosanthes scabra]|uniref:RRM domain-containing protein n=1 Tax=Stylosanthes scabra TaxID=79078 RepID=A0ABU6WML4_9FABA|nr:hypothetical protein [Stylosanthes scabra]
MFNKHSSENRTGLARPHSRSGSALKTISQKTAFKPVNRPKNARSDRTDTRGAGDERGKHSEAAGIANRRDKGESAGLGLSGVKEGGVGYFKEGGVGYFKEYEKGTHTVFLNNLPKSIMKGEIYKDFCGFGLITDVYVSRKKRRSGKGPFAFIRFNSYIGARRAVERMNGRWWKGKWVHAMISKYKRSTWRKSLLKKGRRQRWIATGRTIAWNCGSTPENEKKMDVASKGKRSDPQRREIKLNVSQFQSDLLLRSLMGYKVKPIDFGRVEKSLRKTWEEIKEKSLGNQSLLSIFDEVRHHWGSVWSLSRRVWVEAMGLPTAVWSEETFKTIAELWGKYVYTDDRTEEFWSFSVARFLIDSFE